MTKADCPPIAPVYLFTLADIAMEASTPILIACPTNRDAQRPAFYLLTANLVISSLLPGAAVFVQKQNPYKKVCFAKATDPRLSHDFTPNDEGSELSSYHTIYVFTLADIVMGLDTARIACPIT